MDRIELEFVRARHMPWLGLLFLLLSLGLATYVFEEWVRIRRVNEQRREQIERLELAVRQRRIELAAALDKRKSESAITLKAYAPVVDSLNYPWNRVFAEIEDASGKDVALLSFTHDQGTAVTHVVVETLELPAMSQFVEKLNVDETGRWYIASYRTQPKGNPPTLRGEITNK